MCRERKREKAFISGTADPSVVQVIRTYCRGNGMELEIIPEKNGVTDLDYLKEHLDPAAACVYIQHPNYYGTLEPAAEAGAAAHEAGAKFIMGVNPISLGILKTPREYGADVAVGDGQPLGLPMAFGGPVPGLHGLCGRHDKKAPWKDRGTTVDHNGKTGYVLTLQAREQHIRREKASSNICSNQALCALAVSVYLSAMGNEGLEKAAVQCMSKAHYLAGRMEELGYRIENGAGFFHEFVTVSGTDSQTILEALEKKGILGGYPLDDHRILWCCTEMNTKEEMDEVIQTLKEV